MKFPHEYASLRLTNVTWTLHFAKRATLFEPRKCMAKCVTWSRLQGKRRVQVTRVG